LALHDLVLAITGASGAPYAARLVEVLLRAERTLHVTISPAAQQVFAAELDRQLDLKHFDPRMLLPAGCGDVPVDRLHYHHFMNFQAGIASGSFLTGGMVVCPCSMGTVSAIAHGTSQNLIHRAADVHLKERRKLILVPRETPLGLVQLRNLTACVEAGAVVLPAMPAFYTRPRSLQDMVDFIVGRICDQLGVPHHLLRRWGETAMDH
jgi:4-hydroxy-3-polyprenylbenzoate decarboxylase